MDKIELKNALPEVFALRGGFRLFQCLGFLVCRQGDGHQHTQ
jgi:hypothetical protein